MGSPVADIATKLEAKGAGPGVMSATPTGKNGSEAGARYGQEVKSKLQGREKGL